MPRVSDTIPINNIKLDRRIKLTQQDKADIIELYGAGCSMRELARNYKVDRKTIKNTVDPLTAEKSRLQSMEHSRELRAKTKQSAELKAKRAEAMRKHRDYKKELYEKNLI